MTERKKSYVICPKCGDEAFKVHDPEQVKRDYSDMNMQILLLRQYQCINKECAYVWELSLMETVKAFAEMRKHEGKTDKDIIKELKKVKKDE